jgi:hypothetical protein
MDIPIKEDNFMKKYIRILLAIIAAIACLSLAACSADSDYEREDIDDDNLPIILHSFDIETEVESVGAFRNSLDEKCATLGGYSEDVYTSRSSGEYTHFSAVYRIPQKNADAFIDYIENNSNVEYLSDDATDASTNGADAAVERNALETKAKLLAGMLDDSSLSVKDRMDITDQIVEITKKINRIDAALADSKYVTIEVDVSKAPTTLDNVMGFVITIAMVGLYPTFVIVAIVVVLVILKKNKKKKAQVVE